MNCGLYYINLIKRKRQCRIDFSGLWVAPIKSDNNENVSLSTSKDN